MHMDQTQYSNTTYIYIYTCMMHVSTLDTKMKKPFLISLLGYSAITIILALAAPSLVIVSADGAAAAVPRKGPKAVQKWFDRLHSSKEKVAKLHFYFHDVVSGRNPTAIPVAQGNSTFSSPTLFGLVSVIDNPLTVGPGPRSRILGRAQGITGYASSEEMCLMMTLNFVFTAGKYNGSTLSVVGFNPINQEYREMAVVGGSGVFRLARGVATAETAKFNPKSGNAVVEYTVMVIHY